MITKNMKNKSCGAIMTKMNGSQESKQYNPNAAQIQQEDNMKDQEVKFFFYSKTYCFLHFLFFQNPISRIHSTFGAFTAIQLNGMWNLDISNFADIHQTL